MSGLDKMTDAEFLNELTPSRKLNMSEGEFLNEAIRRLRERGDEIGRIYVRLKTIYADEHLDWCSLHLSPEDAADGCDCGFADYADKLSAPKSGDK